MKTRAEKTAYQREWYKRHRNEILLKLRAEYEANRDVLKEKAKKLWHSKPKEERQSISRRRSLKERYGLTEAEFDQMAVSQNHACVICGRLPTGRLHVDHDHKTKEIRGLLCLRCNSYVGEIERRPDVFERAKQYLQRCRGSAVAFATPI